MSGSAPVPRPASPRGTSSVGFAFGASQASALPGPVLVTLLGHLGIPAAAARQLMKRLRDLGWLTTTPAGRVTVYRPAGEFADTLDSLRGEAAPAPAWQGSFHTVVYDLPESRRTERDRLRSAGFAAGFAALRPGVLIGLSQADWLREFEPLRNIPAVVEAGVLAADLSAARRMAEQAWDLPSHRGRVREAVDQIRAVTPLADADGWGCLRALHDVFAAATPVWRGIPNLPQELVPDGLGACAMAQAVSDQAQRLGRAMQPGLTSFLASHPQAALIEPSEEVRY